MLAKLLSYVQESSGPVSFDELSRRLQIQRSAVEPMVDMLVQKRLLTEWVETDTGVVCGGRVCGTSCAGLRGCPLGVEGMPRTLEPQPPR